MRRWLCRCDCGKGIAVSGAAIRSEHTRSCGCLHSELTSNMLVKRNTMHGMTGTKEHRSWAGMIARCHNKNTPCYYRYGGRGIIVCEQWRNSFEAFFADVGPAPSPSHTLERKDNAGNYEPGNVRWATRKEQNRNTRRTRFLTHDGKTLCLLDWAALVGLEDSTLRARLKRGWSVSKALGTPLLA